MARKCLLIALSVILTLNALLLISCSCEKGRVSGKYFHEDDPESYLELYSDGTFYLYYDAGLEFGTHTGIRGGLDGTYKVRNGTIILSSTLGASKLWINDGELRDEQGKRWLKRIDDTSTQEMTPEEVVRAYVIYLTKTDYEGTRSLIHSDSLYDFPSKVEFEEQLSSESAWEISNFKEIEITDVEIENSTACVEGIIYYKQESSRYPEGMDTSVVFYLAKEYGQWKIVTEEAEPIMDEQEAAETELLNIQSAVTSMMVDNGITELPNPVTIPTNDMSLFPDATSVCGFDKLRDWDGNLYVHGQDKDGYVLYQHDITADAGQDELVNYVATQYTSGSYTVDKYGKVTQVTTGYE